MIPVIPLTEPICALFWKISSFRITGKIAMSAQSISSQSTSLPVGPVQPDAAQQLVPSAPPAIEIANPPSKPVKESGIRRMLLAGTGLALLAAASLYGWDYWATGRFL